MANVRVLVPKKLEHCYDVLVAGGGLAGVMAAIAAAREGKQVLLIEKYGCLGGMATAGLVFPFMRDCEIGSGRQVNAGLYLSMLEELYAMGGSNAPHSKQYKDELLKILLDRMVTRAGVKVLFHSKLCEAEMTDGCITSVTVATVSGMLRLRAKVLIDATGNADLCAFAGLPFQLGREEDGLCQPMTLCFRFANVDMERFDRRQATAAYQELRARGEIRNPRENVLSFRCSVDHVLHMNTTRANVKDPTDVEEVSGAEMLLREQMLEMYHFMREHVPGMEACELISSAVEAGIRESRRIVGVSCLTTEDVTGVRKREDSIARGAYGIDIHNPAGTGTFQQNLPPNEYYTVPYGALVPVRSHNVIVAGRSISSTHEALSAVRVMPITSCIGEAAGIAAAMAIDGDTGLAEVNVPRLREKITGYGGLV